MIPVLAEEELEIRGSASVHRNGPGGAILQTSPAWALKGSYE